jgi:site-specific DNA-methyltransferase (adenine-specific)
MESSAVQPEISATPFVKKKIIVKKKAVIAPAAAAPSGSKQITAIFGDCREKLSEVADKSIQTVCIDPPYNIGKDTWDNIDDYIPWMTGIIQQLETKMKDNGSLFVFHNDMEQVAELMVSIKKNTKLQFKHMIVWNKRFDASSKKGFLDGFIVKNVLHNWNKMAEYILYYTFDNTWKMADARKKGNVSQLTISSEIRSKTGGLTGWYSNLETGKNLPTEDTIKPITKHLGLTFDDIVPKYHNLKKNHSVWNYDIARRSDVHITPKPVDLLENIILHTTDENDTVLDCFAGSGTIAAACLNTQRKCIMIEKDPVYYQHIINSYGGAE